MNGFARIPCTIEGPGTTCGNTLTWDLNPGDNISVLVSGIGQSPASFTWSATVSPPAFAYP